MEKIPTYGAVHKRLRRKRGLAADLPCTQCAGMAKDWALVGEPKWFDPRPYTNDLSAYAPMCRSCHMHVDIGVQCSHGPDSERDKRGACRECGREWQRSYNEKHRANRKKQV